MPIPRLRRAWWLVMLGLSATLSLHYVLPLLTTAAGEYSPFHTHLLYGGTAADRAWLLAHHPHGQPAAPLDPAPAAPPDAPGVTVTSAGGGLLDLLNLAAGSGALLGAFDWPHPTVPLALWLLLIPAGLTLLGLTAPPPDRPPRRA